MSPGFLCSQIEYLNSHRRWKTRHVGSLLDSYRWRRWLTLQLFPEMPIVKARTTL